MDRMRGAAHRLALLSLTVTIALTSAQQAPMTLHLIPQATSDAFGAKLLSGETPGYYVRKGTAATKFRLHLRGGGWCFSVADCASRIGTELGSSSVWPASIYSSTNSPFGFMTDNATENPAFADYNTIFVPYGDGTSWTSNREEPITYNNKQIWFRGRRNLDALLFELNATMGFLSTATEVVLTGTSAGGLAVYLHAAYVQSQLPKTCGFSALPDAGFFLDAPKYGTSTFGFRESIMGAIGPSLWNASIDGTNTACLAAYPAAEAWRCFFAQYVQPFNSGLRFFIMQSLYDSAQVRACVRARGCNRLLII